MNLVFSLILATTIGASTLQTVTVTGPITGTPAFLDWSPGPAPIAEAHPLPLPDLAADANTWLGIAWYWIRVQWLDSQFFNFWLIYQFAVALLGNMIGNILGRGGFFRLDRKLESEIERAREKSEAAKEAPANSNSQPEQERLL